MSSQSDPDVPRTLYIAVVSVILVFVVVIGLQAWFYHVEEAEVLRKQSGQSAPELLRLRAEQLDRLNNYRWADRKNNVVAIPIDRAMQLVVDELAIDSTRWMEAAGEQDK
jgi:hypothetical protein